MSDRPKIIEKFSQLADENGHVLLPGNRGPMGNRGFQGGEKLNIKQIVKKIGQKISKIGKIGKKSEKSDFFY